MNHFQTMNVEKSAHSASFPNRLGGGVELVPNTNFDCAIGVDGNIGLIGAEITNLKQALWLRELGHIMATQEHLLCL